MTHCTWLGSREDPSTHFAYPIEENKCCAPNGPRLLELAHQARWCLAEDHSACSFFVSPDSISAFGPPEWISTKKLSRRIRLEWFAALGGVLVLLLIAAILAVSGQNRTNGIGTGSADFVTATLARSPTLQTSQPSAIIQPATLTPTVTVTPLPSSTASLMPLTYTVQPGDTLAKIAAQFGVSVTAIADSNNIKDPTKLRTGTILIIPGKFPSTKTPVP